MILAKKTKVKAPKVFILLLVLVNPRLIHNCALASKYETCNTLIIFLSHFHFSHLLRLVILPRLRAGKQEYDSIQQQN